MHKHHLLIFSYVNLCKNVIRNNGENVHTQSEVACNKSVVEDRSGVFGVKQCHQLSNMLTEMKREW